MIKGIQTTESPLYSEDKGRWGGGRGNEHGDLCAQGLESLDRMC